MSRQKRAHRVLLAETNGLLRQTVAITARSAGIADVQEASSLSATRRQLMEQEFDGLILRLDDERAMLTLVEAVRAGKAFTRRNVGIALLAERCDHALASEIVTLGIRHLLLPPFRAKAVLSTMDALLTQPA